MPGPSMISLADHGLRNCMELLHNARHYACDAQRPAWDFALRLEEVHCAGVGPSELRYLISKGWVAHGEDQPGGDCVERRVAPHNSLVFNNQSCFVLTDHGVLVFTDLNATGLSPIAVVSLQPRWDVSRHELRVGEHLVKRFRSPAINQEAILTAFEEEHWPTRIDDPMPPVGDTDPKRRLCDTIKCLNRNQSHERVRFRGDGTGEGVLWDLV